MKIVFVGLGGIGQRHLRNLCQLLGSQLDVHAFRSRRLTQVVSDKLDIVPDENIETKYGITVHDTWQQALEVVPDVVMICNPSSLHMEYALASARAGIPVFVEKPLSHEWDRVAELLAVADDRRLVGFVGYQLRFHPCVKRLQELLASGSIGRLVAVRMQVGEYLPGWHKYEDYRTMYAARRGLGGGVILSQIHELDILYSVLGVADNIHTVGGHLTKLELDVEDTASSLMAFVNEGRTIPAHLHQDYIQRPPRRAYEFIGDEGKIEVDMLATTLTWFDREGAAAERLSLPDFQRNELFLAQMRHMLACLRGEATPLVSLRDGAQSLRMAIASLRSLAEKRVVDVQEIVA